jgi:hypothetical protein
MMEGKTNLSMIFNVNGTEVLGSIKYNDRDTFAEIVYKDNNQEEKVAQKLYNGSLDNKEQMISEIESLIEELHIDIDE